MTDEITLPPLPPAEWLGYDPERGDLHGHSFDVMREFARAAVLLDRRQHALRGLAEADRALGLRYDDDAPEHSGKPTAENASYKRGYSAAIDDALRNGMAWAIKYADKTPLHKQSAPQSGDSRDIPVEPAFQGHGHLAGDKPAPSAGPVQIDKRADIKTDAISSGEEAYMDADPCPRKMAAQWRRDAARYRALRDLACEQHDFMHDGTPWCCHMHEDEDGRLDLAPASGAQLDRLVDALIVRVAGEVRR
jgi:hypothetical protein